MYIVQQPSKIYVKVKQQNIFYNVQQLSKIYVDVMNKIYSTMYSNYLKYMLY